MTEVDVQQIDIQDLNSNVEDLETTITTMTYVLYYVAGATAIVFLIFMYSLFRKYCNDLNKNKAIKVSEESVSLLSSVKNLESKINDLDSKVAIAIEIQENNSNNEKSKL